MLAKCLISAFLQFMLLKMNLQTCAAKILEGNEKNPSEDLAQAACEGEEECDVGLHMMQKKTLNQKSPLGMMEALDNGTGVKSHQESMIEKFGDDKGSRAHVPPPFERGEWSSNVCPVHYLPITSEKDCKSAADQMNMRWMGTVETKWWHSSQMGSREPSACITEKESSQMQGFSPGKMADGSYHGGIETFTNTVKWKEGGAKSTNEAPYCKFQAPPPEPSTPAGCIRPQGWCIHSDAHYAVKDCDGDGVADPYCTDIHGHTGFIPSAGSCKDTWPGGTCKCARPQGWCIHSGAHYAEQDCDGDGVADPYCTDGHSKGFIPSAGSCKDTWPGGTC